MLFVQSIQFHVSFVVVICINLCVKSARNVHVQYLAEIEHGVIKTENGNLIIENVLPSVHKCIFTGRFLPHTRQHGHIYLYIYMPIFRT